MKILKVHIKILAVIVLSLTTTFIKTNAQNINTLEQSFSRYQQNNLTEKLYVHTDKSFYVSGELIWFKLYAVDGSTGKPLDLSKVAYAEILDARRSPVLQGKISMYKGSGNGSFYIPLTLSNGNYTFRAYTSWMKNYSPEFYFEKQLTIVNTLRSPDAVQVKINRPEVDLQFFPEGGDLVRGLTSKVAFKITGSNGRGMALKGAIINQRNDTVARLIPLKFGMGNLMFTPLAGNTYRGVIKYAGKSYYYPLPEIKNEGYVMQVTDAGTALNIIVTGSTAAGNQLYAFTHSRQIITDAQNFSLINNKGGFSISKDRLADGISHITLFNSSRQPVCERLYYKRPLKKLNIAATVNQKQYSIRQVVNLNMLTSLGSGQNTAADLSVAVYRADSLQKPEDSNIFSYLWLSSELKGHIETPGYYFQQADNAANEALDNLMLTQGWRRFNWAQVLSSQKPNFAYLPEYTGHLIAGKLTDVVTNKPAPGIIAYLSTPGKTVDLYNSQSDSAGRLLFNAPSFYGDREVILQTNTRKDSIYRIELTSPFSEQFANTILPALQLNTSMQKDLEGYNLSMQLQNTYSGKKLRRYFSPPADSSAFYGSPFKSYQLDDFVRFTTMEEVLREYVTNISVTNTQQSFHIRAIDETSFLDDEPLILLDGVPVFNMNRAFAIDPLKVKRLDVVRNRYFYGPSLFEGILSFSTYKGDLGGFEIDPHAVVLDYDGLQLQREFYSPVYGTTQQQSSRLPDFRNVLYWEPNAGTNAQGRNSLQFYTSDMAGKYIISIEGITTDGEAGSQQVQFEVKK